MTFEITIVETLSRKVTIEAKTAYAARDEVENSYLSGDIILDADDFDEYEMYITDVF